MLNEHALALCSPRVHGTVTGDCTHRDMHAPVVITCLCAEAAVSALDAVSLTLACCGAGPHWHFPCWRGRRVSKRHGRMHTATGPNATSHAFRCVYKASLASRHSLVPPTHDTCTTNLPKPESQSTSSLCTCLHASTGRRFIYEQA